MSREIESITNVVAYGALDATGEFFYTSAFQQPDEIVIRQITYSSVEATRSMFLVDSNFGIIGSVVNDESFVSHPQTRIQIRSPISGPLRFILRDAVRPGPPSGSGVDLDMISIHMDFIKYRH